jgi:spermidine synthase
MPPLRQVRYESDIGVVRVLTTEKTGTSTYILRGGHQTAVDRAGVSLDTYIHALYGFLSQTKARDILMIGCGGGTLATMLARAGKRLTVVDIDKNAFTIAKRHFQMPASVTCRVADGLAYMQKARKRYDALILDAFIGEKIPPHMKGDEICQAAMRCLRKGGLLLMNVCLSTRSDRTADKLAVRFQNNGWQVRLVDSPRIPARNAIVLGGRVGKLREPEVIVRPETGLRQLTRELAAMRFRDIRES